MADTGVTFAFPPHPLMPIAASALSFLTAATLDSTADDIGFVFRAHEAMTITHVGYRVASITGAPGLMRVGIQSVLASTGLPSGTWLGGTAAGYADVTSHGSANTFKILALGESVTLARGDIFALYLDPLSGTWDGSNLITVTYSVSNGPATRNPYGVVNGAKVANSVPCCLLRTASKSYGYPIETLPTIAPTSSTTPDEFGLKFTLPAWCSSYTVAGIRIAANYTANRSIVVSLYDTDGTTVLQNLSIDTDQVLTGVGTIDLFFDEVTLSILIPGSTYRVGIAPGASAAGTFYLMTVPAAGDMSALTPATVAYCERTDAGAWTDVATQLPCLQLLIAGMSVSGGASILGGGVVL